MIDPASWRRNGIACVLQWAFYSVCFAAVLTAVFPVSRLAASTPKDIVQSLSMFETVCEAQTETGRVAENAHLAALNGLEKQRLSKRLGLTEVIDAAWTGEGAFWVQIQKDLSDPHLCEFVLIGVPLEEIKDVWAEKAKADPKWRQESAAHLMDFDDKVTGKGLLLAGVYSVRPFGEGFVLRTVSGYATEDEQIAIFQYGTMGRAPAACEHWPEECK